MHERNTYVEIYLPMCTVPISLISVMKAGSMLEIKLSNLFHAGMLDCMTATTITLHSDNVKQFAKILVVQGTLTPHGKTRVIFSKILIFVA